MYPVICHSRTTAVCAASLKWLGQEEVGRKAAEGQLELIDPTRDGPHPMTKAKDLKVQLREQRVALKEKVGRAPHTHAAIPSLR